LAVRGALENPAAARRVVLVDGVVAGGDALGADGAGGLEQSIELEVVVAERAGNGRAAVQILVDKGADDILLEALLLVDDVIGNSEVLGDAAGVVDVIERAAAAGLGRVGDAVLAGEARLVPELEGEADDRVARVGEHGRNRRGVDSSGHGDGDCFVLGHMFVVVPSVAELLYKNAPPDLPRRPYSQALRNPGPNDIRIGPSQMIQK
jgi:hypothetical protein